jgi:hypothetical protein
MDLGPGEGGEGEEVPTSNFLLVSGFLLTLLILSGKRPQPIKSLVDYWVSTLTFLHFFIPLKIMNCAETFWNR